MNTKKTNKNVILKYIVIFFVCVIFSNASINGLNPFLFALFFALIFAAIDEKLLATFVLSSVLIQGFNLETFLVSISVVAVGLIYFYIHRFAKKRMRLWTLFIAYFVSLSAFIYYNYTNIEYLLLYIALGAISLFAFIQVSQVLMLKKNCFKLTLDESICFLYSIAVLGSGFGLVQIFGFELYRVVITLAVFVLSSVGGMSLAVFVSLAFAFGVALTSGSLSPIAEFAILNLVAGLFPAENKVKNVVGVIICEVFLQYFFNFKDFYIIYPIIPIIFAGILFIFMPRKILNNMSDFVYVKKSEISSRNLINTTRKNIKKRMLELSNVFLEMKQLHLNMVKKSLTKEELNEMLTREVMSSCCKDCLDKNKCTRALGVDNKSNIETLIEIAITKGKVTLLDIPSGLSNRCGKVNNLISLINRLCDEYRQYRSMLTDINNVKILLAEQMGAVSKLLVDVGGEIDTNVRFDIARENKIVSRLLSHNVECREVLLYNEKNDISAEIVVRSDANFPLVEKVLTENLKCPMIVTKTRPIDDSNFISLTLKKRGKYDCVFGLASCNKSGNDESGDCHSIIRLGGDKFLLALCDGMGAGVKAHKMSAMTLGLIEDFYKVGFDNDIILESVNKLLAINNQESYSTLDICLMDLDNETADYIKVGAPFGVVKRGGQVEVIEGGALPIGALDNVTPFTKKGTLSTSDVVIMATDGVTDAFESVDAYTDFISKLVSTNPQVLAETILNEALDRNDMSARDDMTVLVARIYLKN